MKVKLTLLTAFSVAVTLAARAGNPGVDAMDTKKNDIAGGVFHNQSKRPINKVSVSVYLVSKKEKVVFTDDNGFYAFDSLKSGTYKLVFEKQGYKKVTRDKVLIKEDDGFQLNVEMIEEKDFDFMPSAFGF